LWIAFTFVNGVPRADGEASIAAGSAVIITVGGRECENPDQSTDESAPGAA